MSRGPFVQIRQRLGLTSREDNQRLIRICGSADLTVLQNALVVGHNRQPESRAALDVAIDFAKQLDASLHVVHVVDLPDYPIDPDSADWEAYASERLAEEQAAVSDALRSFGSGWSYYIGRGDPARRLIQVADEHDALMIVVGSRRDGASASLGRLFEPRVLHRLIQEASSPVLVVAQQSE